MALLDHQEQSNEPERNTTGVRQTGYCNYKDHVGERELPAQYFGKYKSGNPKSICLKCDSLRAAIYKRRALADPKRAERYRETQRKAAERWRKANPELQAEYRRLWAEKHPEKVKEMKAQYDAKYPGRRREIQKRWREKVKADPYLHQQFLESRRMQYRLRREREGKPVTRSKAIPMTTPYKLVDAAPLQEFIRARNAMGMTNRQIGLAAGLDESQVRRVSQKGARVSLFVADKLLHSMNGPSIWSVFPDA